VQAREIATVDYHTAGEPFRIVADPPVAIPGRTVAERRAAALDDLDVQALRAVLCSEPRGHADMYGGFVVPPDDDDADLGVLFWHKDGFSTACGHGTIALGVWAVDSGLVAAPATGSAEVVIDVPSGRVTARVLRERGHTVAVEFVNVPSWHIASDVPVDTSRGEVHAAIAFGGAIYAMVPAAELGLAVDPVHLGELITLGREIKWALDGSTHAQHPDDPRLSGVYGTIFYDELGDTADGLHQRNVAVFADGEVDRSPCGSGTCARLAALVEEGRLPPGGTLRHDSIIGSTFLARVVGTVDFDGRRAVVPQVTGMAYRTGEHRFTIDPADPLVPGFVLR
jgi:proline racemase